MIFHPETIQSALWVMGRAGFTVAWVAACEYHLFKARAVDTGESWIVLGDDPLKAIGELMNQCGFEDIE